MATYPTSICEKEQVYIVIDFWGVAENASPLGAVVVYMGSVAAGCAVSPLNLQDSATIFLMENGKFPVWERNALRHTCSLLNSLWKAGALQLFKASSTSAVTDVLSTIILLDMCSINLLWCPKGGFENPRSLEAMLFGHNQDNYNDPFRCTPSWK